MPKKSRQKYKNLENDRGFKMKQKVFFIIFEGLLLKQIIKSFFGRWDSDFKTYNYSWCKYLFHLLLKQKKNQNGCQVSILSSHSTAHCVSEII